MVTLCSAWLPLFHLRKSGEALAQAAQGGGGGVTIPGGVQELWRCGTEGHGLWHGGGRFTVGLDELRGPFQY